MLEPLAPATSIAGADAETSKLGGVRRLMTFSSARGAPMPHTHYVGLLYVCPIRCVAC
jgi:hypothetical protein